MKCFNRNGLSFVEAIVATLVLALIMAAFYGLHIMARDTLSVAHHKAIAMFWAHAAIETQRAVLPGDAVDPSQTQFLSGTKAGQRAVNTEVLEALSNDGALQRVYVRVDWTE